jgi:Endoribonuclease L-PSP
MAKEIIHTDNAPKSLAGYSQAVKAGGFVFVAGQGPCDGRCGRSNDPGAHQAVSQERRGYPPGGRQLSGQCGECHIHPGRSERLRGDERRVGQVVPQRPASPPGGQAPHPAQGDESFYRGDRGSLANKGIELKIRLPAGNLILSSIPRLASLVAFPDTSG